MSNLEPEAALFAARIKAELSRVPDVDSWRELVPRLRAAEQTRHRWLPISVPTMRSRGVMVAIAVSAILAVAAGGTVAAGSSGAIASWLQSMGFAGTTTSQVTAVQASATVNGVTVKATEAYRDAYVLAVSLEVDNPAPLPNTVIGGTVSGGPTVVTSSGQILQLVGERPGEGVATQNVEAFAAADGGQLSGDEVTLTVPQVTRFLDPLHSKASQIMAGPWVVKLRLPASTSSTQPLLAPAGGTVGRVQVTYRDFRVSRSYLSGWADVAELEPNVVLPTGPPTPAQLDHPTTTMLQVYGPNGRRLEPVATLGDVQGKGEIVPPSTTRRTFHWGYLFASQGPGTYRVVMQSGGGSMERELRVP